MVNRVIDMALYLVERAWTVCATLLAIAFIGALAAIAAPVSHPERVVISIK